MRWTGLFALAVLAVSSASTGADVPDDARSVAPSDLVPSGLSVVAERRTFAPELKLPGQVLSTRRHDVVSHYRYWMTIQWLAPEGTQVLEGDVVARVANETIHDRIRDHTKEMRKVRTRRDRVHQRSRLAQIEGEHEVGTAQLALRRAEAHLAALERGAAPEEVRLAEIECQRRCLELEVVDRALQRVRLLTTQEAMSEETVRRLEGEHRLGAARLERAQAEQRVVEAGQTERELLTARSGVALARAKVEALRAAEAASRSRREAEVAREEEMRRRLAIALEHWKAARQNEERKAPVSGVLLCPPIYSGGKARPGLGPLVSVPVAAIIDPSSAAFVAWATEEQVSMLRIGQAARVRLQSAPSEVLEGRVTAVAVTGEDLSLKSKFAEDERREDTRVRVYDVTVEIGPSPGVELLHGTSGLAEVKAGGATEAVVVPRVCLRREEDEWWALVWRESQWQPRRVHAACGDDDEVAVTSGIVPGERVAILSE